MTTNQNIKCFVIEGSKIILQDIVNKIGECGCVVLEKASNGREALAKLQLISATPDLVLLDLILPDQDGLELVPAIFKLFPEVKIIATTSMAKLDIAKTAFSTGVHEYLVKPFNEQKLLGILSTLFP